MASEVGNQQGFENNPRVTQHLGMSGVWLTGHTLPTYYIGSWTAGDDLVLTFHAAIAILFFISHEILKYDCSSRPINQPLDLCTILLHTTNTNSHRVLFSPEKIPFTY